MTEASKLKPVHTERQILGIVLVSLGTLAIFIAVGAMFGEPLLDRFIAVLMALAAWFDLLILIRTRNPAYLAAFGWQALMAVRLMTRTENRTFLTIYAVAVILLAGIFFAAAARKRTKWRYREVLELAARPVTATRNGYTDRPYPSGRADYTMEELQGFARFLQKRMIALPYFEKNRIVLQIEPSFWHLFYLRYGYEGCTHVAFDDTGRISVYISEKSYRKYKDELSFDALCRAMGRLFVDFLELYRRESGAGIIERMNGLKLSGLADGV